MAREEKEPDTPPRNPLREVLDSTFHGGFIDIAEERDLKAEAAQGVRHVRGTLSTEGI